MVSASCDHVMLKNVFSELWHTITSTKVMRKYLNLVFVLDSVAWLQGSNDRTVRTTTQPSARTTTDKTN